jgi:hypothetical protein
MSTDAAPIGAGGMRYSADDVRLAQSRHFD